MEKERPKVGVGVIILKDNKVLLHKRKGSHGEGSWSFPGGHLEFNESLEQCAIREVEEETGIKIQNVRFATITNDIFPLEKKHYVTVYMLADHLQGAPKNKEPEKAESWSWFSWEELPKPLFIPVENLLKQNFNPFELQNDK